MKGDADRWALIVGVVVGFGAFYLLAQMLGHGP